MTVNDLLDGLESDYRLRDKWKPNAASSIKPLREYFGTRRAVDVTTNAITAYVEKMRAEDYRNATINRTTQLLGQSYKVAIRNKQLSVAPFIPAVVGDW